MALLYIKPSVVWSASPNHDLARSRLRILVLGSYAGRHLGFLRALRDGLRGAGYANARLVEDFPDPGAADPRSAAFEKSMHWMARADACVLVFFERGANDGALMELVCLADGRMMGKCIFAYGKALLGKTSSLFPGFMAHCRGRALVVEYRNISDLVKGIKGLLTNRTVETLNTLILRRDDDWDLSTI